MKVAVGITGGSGAIYALALLKYLGEIGVERHLVASRMGLKVMEHECGVTPDELGDFCDVYHDNDDVGAVIASGSYPLDGMVIVPCSMRTLGGIASGCAEGLLGRAADVCLKEKRRLILTVREMPFSELHLENMTKLARMGATILPACPGFYNHPQSLEDIIRFVTGKMLDELGIKNTLYKEWNGVYE